MKNQDISGANQASAAANLAAGKPSSGATTTHNCETHQQPPLSKAQKKKLEEQKRAEQERIEALAREEALAKEQASQEELEAFKSQSRVRLDFLHAFGNYSGSQISDVYGQVHIIKDEFGGFANLNQDSPEGDENRREDDHTSNANSFSRTQSNMTKAYPQAPSKQSHLQLPVSNDFLIVYPVGRHIAFKSMETKQMRFLLLPVDAREVQAISFNNAKNMIAIAVKMWTFQDYEKHHINVFFYSLEPGLFFKLQSQYTIRVTKGGQIKDQIKNVFVDEHGQKGSEMFPRYVNSMAFSKDDKFFVLSLVNAPKQCYVIAYDLLIKGKRMSMSKFDGYKINKVTFLSRDTSKLVVAGDNLFRFYSTAAKKLEPLPEFENFPAKPKQQVVNGKIQVQSFTSFCYTESEHLIGCSQTGDLFVIEIMSVIQVINPASLIAPGTPMGKRTAFKIVRGNKYGFVAATDDILYFFQFKTNRDSQKELKKGKGYYECFLKWRANEFRNTQITSLAIYEPDGNKNPEDSYLVVSTKNKQILYLNLYTQIYFPDHQKLKNDMKIKGVDDSDSHDEDTPVDSEEEEDVLTRQQIKSVGIEEEENKAKNANSKLSNLEKKKIQAEKENEALIDQIRYSVVAGGFHEGEISCMDICIQRPIIATLSKEDSSIRVWNYDSGECELVKSYHSLQKEFQNTNQTYLQSVALHPSGFYMAVSFIDRVKVYHLMQNEIREYRSLDIKNCHSLKFSNGGQYLACIDLKDISLFNAFTLEKPKKMPCPSNQVSQIDFNGNDTIVTVVSRDGFIQKYDILKGAKTGECVIDKQCYFSSCLFVKQTQQADEHVYVVGKYLSNQSVLRTYNEKENIDQEIQYVSQFDSTKFTDIACFDLPSAVKPGDRVRNLVVSLDNGRLLQFGMPPNLKPGREIDMMNAHHGTVKCLKRSFDSRILVTAGKDGSLFIFRAAETQNKNVGWWTRKKLEMKEKLEQEERNRLREQRESHNEEKVANESEEGQQQTQPKKQEKLDDSDDDSDSDMNKVVIRNRKRMGAELFSVVDKRLSNIVLIEKQMMEEWRKQQEQLKLDMEKENNTVESSLRREKYVYETDIAQMERIKSKKLNELNQEYEDLQLQEAEEKDENTQTMKKLELNHIQCMEELQSLYEKKLQMEQHQFNQLSQEKEEMKQNFQQEIKELQKLNEQAVEKLLNDFKDELQTVQDEYDKSKRTADGLKMIYEEKITQSEDDNTGEIREIKRVYEKEIEQLNDVINTIKDDIETIKREKNREREETTSFTEDMQKARLKKSYREEKMREKEEEIRQLEAEKKEIQDKLKEKERELYKYKFKIKDLQKTKQVLTHRTQEMKASLEPKEQQIENLKEQLLDLEKVFEKQFQAKKNLEQDVDKRNGKIKEMKQKVRQEKGRTKQKEQTIGKFVNKVHSAYKSKNEDVYIKKLMEIYNEFVRHHTDEILENKKKDPETIEELGRQLQYMQKSSNTLKEATLRNQGKTKLNINKRRQENNLLIADLEAVRMSKKKLETLLKEKRLVIQEKKLERQKKQREFDKKLNLIEQETLAKVKMATVQGLAHKEDDPEEDGEALFKRTSGKDVGFFSNEMGVPAKIKGRLYKGTPFIRGNAEDKEKISDLTAQIEESNQQILLQKLEKRSLQEQIIRLLDERADDLGLTEEEKKAQLSKLNIQAFHGGLPQESQGTTNIPGRVNQTFGMDYIPQNEDIH